MKKDKLTINANIQVTPDTLQTIVANAKKIVGPDSKGIYHVDTANMVNVLISRFLEEKNFRNYVDELEHYK